MYCSLNLRKTHLINGDKFSTECGQLMRIFWQQTFGDESEAIKFCHPRWHISAKPRVYLGIPFTCVTVNLELRLVTCEAPPLPPMVGAEGMKIFDFDNPRLLEKALSGKELHRIAVYKYLFTKTISQKCWKNIIWADFFVAPIPHKQYQKHIWVHHCKCDCRSGNQA